MVMTNMEMGALAVQRDANRVVIENLPRIADSLERIVTILNEMMLQSIEARNQK